ncbi:MAG TPA: beta-propeller fold lactonase family protein [Pseudonocardiaceae bacterium]
MNDENTRAQPPESADGHPATQDFPAYVPPAPGPNPGPPVWATPAAQAQPRPLRSAAVLGASLGLSLALVVGLTAAVVSFTPVGDWVGLDEPADARAAAAVAQGGEAQADPAAAPEQGAPNLLDGAVFLQSNDAKANEVVAFARAADGTLTEMGRYPTGGTGSGTVEDVSQGLLLGSSAGEFSPTRVVDKPELLFAPNAGSNTITTFRVKPDGLEMASHVPSGGEKPISVTVANGFLYVLNSGEVDDRFVVGPETAIENCTTGQLPSVTGFKVSPDGVLEQIPGSTRLLSGTHDSGCAQIGFSRDGKVLIVTERRAEKIDEASGFHKGAIITWQVRPDGTLTNQQINEPTGNGPYAFTTTPDGTLLMAEQNGAHGNPYGGFVASYSVNGDGTVTGLGPSVATGGTDTCWITVSRDGTLAFATSPFDTAAISSYTVGRDGNMTRLHEAASAADGKDQVNDGVGIGILDLALSQDDKFLYTIDALNGVLHGFSVNDNGTLAKINSYPVFNLLTLAEGGQGGPHGIAVI